MDVRTRMAPSPTGEYHIGHIRTVLYNYAFSKQNQGRFLIRIEDTDRTRFVEDATERILDVIGDYGIAWDEGPRVGGPYEPYLQSQRLDIYKEYADELVKRGSAYYCFCTEERLSQLREEQRAQGLPSTKYDRRCLHLSADEVEKNLKAGVSHVLRLKVPEDRDITFHDEVWGDITINTDAIDDQVLIKSDGFPTYHFAVVVDDHLMKITHIMRGNDWLPSTPKHVLLYEAFGWEMPKFIHLPNLKELGGSKKLSKRFGSVAAIEFLQEGYLVPALLNFLMFLGWNPGTEKEIYSLDEFIKDFSIDRIQHSDLVAFDRQKLLWLNGHYIRETETKALQNILIAWAKKFGVSLLVSEDNEKTLKILELVKERMKLLSEYNSLVHYFYETPKVEKDKLFSFVDSHQRGIEILANFKLAFESINKDSWKDTDFETFCREVLTKFGYKPKEAFMTLRVALTNEVATPHIFDILKVLDKDESVKRIDSALKL